MVMVFPASALAAEAEEACVYRPRLVGAGDGAEMVAEDGEAGAEGIGDDALRTTLTEVSALMRLVERPPPSLGGLERRMAVDREHLTKALRSLGYYQGAVEMRSTAGDACKGPDEAVVEVAIVVVPGPRYTLRTIAVIAQAPDTDPTDTDPPDAGGETGARAPPGPVVPPGASGLLVGAPALATAVVSGRDRVADAYARLGYAHARVGAPVVTVDHGALAMDVAYPVEPGLPARFGPVRVVGLEGVDEALVRGRLAWVTGELIRPELLEQTRTALLALEVFTSVRIAVAGSLPGGEEGQAAMASADGLTPVTITVAERKRHFVGAGATLATAEGMGMHAYWGHRNLFGNGEHLVFDAALARLNAGQVSGEVVDRTDGTVTARLRQPDLFGTGLDLHNVVEAVKERPLAYQRDAVSHTIRLEYGRSRALRMSAGVATSNQRVRDHTGTRHSLLVGLPLTLTLDRTDSLLDPSRGSRVALELTPTAQQGDIANAFLVTRLTGSLYEDFGTGHRLVLAGRLAVGTIIGSPAADVPADRRFYVGGGGSVRGFAYQRAGPLDVHGSPIGGASYAEAGAEVRIKVTDSIGLVPFLDAGSVHDSLLPRPDQSVRVGTGLGLRYHTDFGPLRADFGVPLDQRRNEDAWQVYFSFGQAF